TVVDRMAAVRQAFELIEAAGQPELVGAAIVRYRDIQDAFVEPALRCRTLWDVLALAPQLAAFGWANDRAMVFMTRLAEARDLNAALGAVDQFRADLERAWV